MSTTTLILIVIGLFGIVLGYFMVRHDKRENVFNFVNSERHLERERRKRMLVKHLKDKKELTSEEGAKLLGVERSTAVRYFDELEEIGVVVQRGKMGPNVYYELVGSSGE